MYNLICIFIRPLRTRLDILRNINNKTCRANTYVAETY